MFDLRRFGQLAVSQASEAWRTYAWFLAIGIIVHFVVLLLLMSGTRGFLTLATDGQAVIYFTGLYLTAPVFAGRYFQGMARRESALLLLMRPASSLEKWLLAVLVVVVLYPLAYTLAFYVCNLPAWLIASERAADELVALSAQATEKNSLEYQIRMVQPERFGLFLPWNAFDSWRELTGVVLSLASLQAFAVLGSLYFRNVAIIKTVVAGFLILLSSMLVANVMNSSPEQFFRYWWARDAGTPEPSPLFLCAWLGIPALLWLACLFALKEREVA